MLNRRVDQREGIAVNYQGYKVGDVVKAKKTYVTDGGEVMIVTCLTSSPWDRPMLRVRSAQEPVDSFGTMLYLDEVELLP